MSGFEKSLKVEQCPMAGFFAQFTLFPLSGPGFFFFKNFVRSGFDRIFFSEILSGPGPKNLQRREVRSDSEKNVGQHP